jgi:hypothetical protein
VKSQSKLAQAILLVGSRSGPASRSLVRRLIGPAAVTYLACYNYGYLATPLARQEDGSVWGRRGQNTRPRYFTRLGRDQYGLTPTGQRAYERLVAR